MAQRRMFSKSITNSSEFLMMSQSAQNLYFHFGMNADDDGFCEVFTIMRMTDSKPDDLQALHGRGFIYVADSKVCIVKDWHENNQIRLDRYKKSTYLDDPKYSELYKTIMEDKLKEVSIYRELLDSGKPNGNQMATQVRLGKVSIGKDNATSVSTDHFDKFWVSYPKKELKKKAKDIWERNKLDKHLEAILSFIEAAKKTERWQKGFIKAPPVFLNGECWNDDLKSYGNLKVNTTVKHYG